jgi:hypothetical protein
MARLRGSKCCEVFADFVFTHDTKITPRVEEVPKSEINNG